MHKSRSSLEKMGRPKRIVPRESGREQGKLESRGEITMVRLFEGTQWDRPPRCDRCGEREEACSCPPLPRQLTPPEKQTARLAVEKRKKGKVVTVVQGLPAEENDLPALLGQLKTACGAGGTVKDDTLEIQGDHLQRVRELLLRLRYRVRT